MITAISWIPKGASKATPELAKPLLDPTSEDFIGDDGTEDDEEMEDLSDQANASRNRCTTKSNGISNGLQELDMDHYDSEDEGIDLFSGVDDLYYPSNDMDPYLKDKRDDDSEEYEDIKIDHTDSVIVCACNEDEFNHHLKVFVYEESEDGEPNMFVHHEIILPAFPLSIAWFDCPLKGGDKGNFVAVGTMDPGIEIWDLDIIDEIQPSAVLGGVVKRRKKNGKTSTKLKDGSHTDSVLCLSWNKTYRNVLASASADKQVKIWDVAAEKCDITMEHHKDKVQAVAWNPHEPQILLSGSFDHSVVMKDGRDPSHPGFSWPMTADVESLAWHPNNSYFFLVSLEDGTVQGIDIRVATSVPTSDLKPCFTLHAHDKAVCAISYSNSAPDLLATGSTDKMVKLWDLKDNQPKCVASKNHEVGAVFSVMFSNDNPFLLAVGGAKKKIIVWDTTVEPEVCKRFGKK